MKVRFAGEAPADCGGPLREFLTLAMERFCDIPSIITGNENSAHFKMIPDRILKNHYNLLGQLAGLSILNIGRGPECFNKLIFPSIFKIPYDEELPEIEDSELVEKLKNIDQGNLDTLYEEGICPTGNVNKNKRLLPISFIVLKNYGAIKVDWRMLIEP